MVRRRAIFFGLGGGGAAAVLPSSSAAAAFGSGAAAGSSAGAVAAVDACLLLPLDFAACFDLGSSGGRDISTTCSSTSLTFLVGADTFTLLK